MGKCRTFAAENEIALEKTITFMIKIAIIALFLVASLIVGMVQNWRSQRSTFLG